jgi:hypothetical protein
VIADTLIGTDDGPIQIFIVCDLQFVNDVESLELMVLGQQSNRLGTQDSILLIHI